MAETSHSSYQIRCLHIDYERPSEDRGEFHWRCRAVFAYQDHMSPWQRDFCPYHRPLYRPTDHVMTREEAEALNRQLSRVHEQVAMPAAKLDGEGLTADERAWADQRRRELMNQAIEAGLVSREAGGEG